MDLPGLRAQLKAAPPFREGLFDKAEINSARIASVLWLMYPKEVDAKEEWEGVLILRSPYEGVHSNQVGMPGGEREYVDQNNYETALRECFEEIGVSVPRENVLGMLSPLYIPPSKFFVHPFVGWLDEKPKFTLDEKEVDKLLFLKLRDLCSDDFWSTYKTKNTKVPGFMLEGHLVWGATAMMLFELKECLDGIFMDTFAE